MKYLPINRFSKFFIQSPNFMFMIHFITSLSSFSFANLHEGSIIKIKSLMDNKFYQKYRGLFSQFQRGYPADAYTRSNIYHKERTQFPLGSKGFNPIVNNNSSNNNAYERSFANFDGKRKHESMASKELAEVILPKLRMYDIQIEKKLRRFKTQHDATISGLEIDGNPHWDRMNSSLVEPLDYHMHKVDKSLTESSPINPFSNNRTFQHARQLKKYKRAYNFIQLQQNDIFHDKKYADRFLKQGLFSSKIYNPEQQQHLPILPCYEANLETEYQRSYSNNKLMTDQQQSKSQTKPSKHHTKEQDYKDLKFDQQKIDPFRIVKKLSQAKPGSRNGNAHNNHNNKTNNKFRIKTQPTLQNHHNQSHLQPSTNNHHPQKQPKPFPSFSEYQQNQFAFINKRLQDIQTFSNYYHHTHINSYKRAIMRRLQAKNNIEKRKDLLRGLLVKENWEL